MSNLLPNRSNFIVSADDFGLSERANRNIFYLIELGKIDRVAIMIEGKFSEKDFEKLMRSGVKIDLHLTTGSVEENQLTRQGSGIFSRGCFFLWRFLFGSLSSRKIAANWDLQIKRFHELFGKYPDGINSHEHVHFFPAYFKILSRLLAYYPIPYLRFGNHNNLQYSSGIARILFLLKKINLKTFYQTNCTSSDKLVSIDWLTPVELHQLLDHPGEGSTEIVCHPAKAEDFVLIKNNF